MMLHPSIIKTVDKQVPLSPVLAERSMAVLAGNSCHLVLTATANGDEEDFNICRRSSMIMTSTKGDFTLERLV